uniref:Succinate-semialdehyde dehydrogenase / glutarate-semialdehyde dehydrogenase n=1 Tax=Candidatus Kentrum sp. TUN TaxID=2126343 RepID=A0A451A552_9GAMM|nr:MAG: succinate-semialdehyde dehydrogenase / glutarate-semialdehyde dehydrogenase [Candidatus Kentron sp. TUN]VFK61563.1 MAG: succinate-semialdehyde dehydrogenase / glutarate-semialdehyde dehydrogenase [Candidatus Kentron sp. TUN]VFK70263.1 MAG: succinate-semialdehyde dehydrogenase / glutarate-semialdehyde dehydrogenase [Candidatus Kentron sp. TUN]
MSIVSINPASGREIKRFRDLDKAEIRTILEQVSDATDDWGDQSFMTRAACLREAAKILRKNTPKLARLITLEMGKLLSEAAFEVEKCARVCEYYAEHGEAFLTDNHIDSDADQSFVAFQPLGSILAIMPWNFPFWQVFRCAAPALMAGNTILLKHAPNVPQCAIALEEIWRDAGCPSGIFQNLPISLDKMEMVIGDPRVCTVTFTGSDVAGREVAALAGSYLKKTVLELGGSDAFVVLDDADLEQAAKVGLKSRFLNSGQSCIAAKRFIVMESIADAFLEHFMAGIERLQVGDPVDPDTTLAPMAREDLRETLHLQVRNSIAKGADLLMGGHSLDKPGWYYAPTLLDRVRPGMPAYEEELFGPVASMIRVRDEHEALRIANDSRYGLGGSVWTGDIRRGERFARGLACGCTFVNGMVKSDPQLPFGGIKDSGYGRELSLPGIREFVNAKTVWIKSAD